MNNRRFLYNLTQFEHTTFDFVLDFFNICVRDSLNCVREKIIYDVMSDNEDDKKNVNE